jgi:hypothetical protein
LLSKYTVKYYECEKCGFVFTEEPYWLKESYEKVITDEDTGILIRNLVARNITTTIIRFIFNKKGSFLDYGSGHGLFVQMMTDRGFDFHGFDNHAKQVFCKKKQVDVISKNFDLITAFEVAEHFKNPMEDFDFLKRSTDNILFTTQIVPKPTPAAENWWYYGTEHGQHISFYSLKSLELIAHKLGLNFTTSENNKYNLTFHLLSKKRVNRILFKALVNYQVSRVLYLKRYQF